MGSPSDPYNQSMLHSINVIEATGSIFPSTLDPNSSVYQNFGGDKRLDYLHEREKMILTTTGSIFQKMEQEGARPFTAGFGMKNDAANQNDYSKFQSFNEDFLKAQLDDKWFYS